MQGKMVELRADGRTTPGYLNVGSGRGPGLVVIQEWWGLVDHIKDVVDRFAAAGFVSLAPDLYHGKQTKSPDDAGKLLMALNIGEAAKDMKVAGDYLRSLPEVQPAKVGIVGFCMGGQLALYAAQEYPDVFSACVDFYGVHPKVQIEPEKLEVPVLAHFGRHDRSVRESEARALVERYRAAGKPFEAHFYEAGHAFFNDARSEAHDPAASELAWRRTIQFLRTHLG